MSVTNEYRGVHLQPRHAQKHILELFSGNENGIPRREMVEHVEKRHIELGGTPNPTRSVEQVLTRALSKIKKSGYGMQLGENWWFRESLDKSFNSTGNLFASDEENEAIEIGSGSEVVYACYLPSYKELAVEKSNKNWPMKIGRSNNPRVRISQLQTGLPESFKIAILWKTDKSKQAENILHGILDAVGRRSKHAKGKEWFYTNPTELHDILTKSDIVKLLNSNESEHKD